MFVCIRLCVCAATFVTVGRDGRTSGRSRKSRGENTARFLGVSQFSKPSRPRRAGRRSACVPCVFRCLPGVTEERCATYTHTRGRERKEWDRAKGACERRRARRLGGGEAPTGAVGARRSEIATGEEKRPKKKYRSNGVISGLRFATRPVAFDRGVYPSRGARTTRVRDEFLGGDGGGGGSDGSASVCVFVCRTCVRTGSRGEARGEQRRAAAGGDERLDYTQRERRYIPRI